jgi:hypothetical protein
MPKKLAQFVQQAARSFMYHESKLSNLVLSIIRFNYKREGYIPRLRAFSTKWTDENISLEIHFGGKIRNDSINQKLDKDHPPMNVLQHVNGAWKSVPRVSQDAWAQEWLEGVKT